MARQSADAKVKLITKSVASAGKRKFKASHRSPFAAADRKTIARRINHASIVVSPSSGELSFDNSFLFNQIIIKYCIKGFWGFGLPWRSALHQ